jgi:beta-galactosidase
MRLWSYQAVARGADAVLYFQWRQSRGGAEKHHSAMVPHGGTEVRTHREVRELGQELAGLVEIAGSRVHADVALVLDWSSWWGLELGSHPSAALTQRDANFSHYAPLWDEHVTTDVVHPAADLSRYRLVVVPNLYLVDENAAANLREYVRRGGHLLMSFFSGIADECDRVHLGGYPAPFRDLLGLRVDEFWPLAEDDTIGVMFAEDASAGGTVWSEWIELEGAEARAIFTDGPLADRAAVTCHAFGDGVAWYVGTRLDAGAMRRLVREVLDEAGVQRALDELPEGVEAVIRHGEQSRYAFLLNHGQRKVAVEPLPGAVALVGDPSSLAPAEVAVLRLPPT